MLNTLPLKTMYLFVVLVAFTAACALENEAEKNKCNGPGDCLNGYSCVQGQCKPNGSGIDGSPSIDTNGQAGDANEGVDSHGFTDGVLNSTCSELEAQFAAKLDQTCTTSADCKIETFVGHLREPIRGATGNCGIAVNKLADLTTVRQIEAQYVSQKCKDDIGIPGCTQTTICCTGGKCVTSTESCSGYCALVCPDLSKTCGDGTCMISGHGPENDAGSPVMSDGGVPLSYYAVETCYNCPQDCGSCCGDGWCHPYRGEDKTTCPSDCN